VLFILASLASRMSIEQYNGADRQSKAEAASGDCEVRGTRTKSNQTMRFTAAMLTVGSRQSPSNNHEP